MRNINVLVTSIGNIGVGSQIVKALKLSDLSLKICGTDISDFNVLNAKVDFFYKVPQVKEDDYEIAIDRIIEKNHTEIIFVGSEAEYHFFSINRKKYEERNIYLAINSIEISEIGFNKFKTFRMLNRAQIYTPQYYKISNLNDCKKIDFFPVVIKPNTSASSSENVYIAFDLEEVYFFVSYMLKNDIDIIAQEYVGNSDSEYTIGVSSDKAGEILGTIIIKRDFSSSISCKSRFVRDEKKYIVSSGITQGRFVHDENIKWQAEMIAKAIKSTGSLNIQMMYVDKILKIIELHPMITGSVYIRALAGYNEPANIIKRELLKKDVCYHYEDFKIIRQLVSQVIP